MPKQRIRIIWITITLGAMAVCHALQQPESSSSFWRPLPDPLEMGRRTMLLGGAAAAMASAGTQPAEAFDDNDNNLNNMSGKSFSSVRSVASIGSNVAIPVWPTWGGGRVVPISLGGPDHDPFLLLAHHKHWFDPRDPLRKPFQTVGKALGLPYVDVEGFSMHPHRGENLQASSRELLVFQHPASIPFAKLSFKFLSTLSHSLSLFCESRIQVLIS
jgi:hypothetical protein